MDKWQVVVARAHNAGDPSDGAEESVLVTGSEPEARRVFADTVAEASEHRYQSVVLRTGSQIIESWPQETGWTS